MTSALKRRIHAAFGEALADEGFVPEAGNGQLLSRPTRRGRQTISLGLSGGKYPKPDPLLGVVIDDVHAIVARHLEVEKPLTVIERLWSLNPAPVNPSHASEDDELIGRMVAGYCARIRDHGIPWLDRAADPEQLFEMLWTEKRRNVMGGGPVRAATTHAAVAIVLGRSEVVDRLRDHWTPAFEAAVACGWNSQEMVDAFAGVIKELEASA